MAAQVDGIRSVQAVCIACKVPNVQIEWRPGFGAGCPAWVKEADRHRRCARALCRCKRPAVAGTEMRRVCKQRPLAGAQSRRPAEDAASREEELAYRVLLRGGTMIEAMLLEKLVSTSKHFCKCEDV